MIDEEDEVAVGGVEVGDELEGVEVLEVVVVEVCVDAEEATDDLFEHVLFEVRWERLTVGAGEPDRIIEEGLDPGHERVDVIGR